MQPIPVGWISIHSPPLNTLWQRLLRSTLAITLLLSAGCANLQPSFETPAVTVTTFQVVPSNTINPRFRIGLHIVNPNSIPLALRGLAYNVNIEGHRIITGASNELPTIAAYGEGDVQLTANADLLGSFSLIGDLLKQQRQALNYQLAIKLDVGGFIPPINVEKAGLIQLSPP